MRRVLAVIAMGVAAVMAVGSAPAGADVTSETIPVTPVTLPALLDPQPVVDPEVFAFTVSEPTLVQVRLTDNSANQSHTTGWPGVTSFGMVSGVTWSPTAASPLCISPYGSVWAVQPGQYQLTYLATSKPIVVEAVPGDPYPTGLRVVEEEGALEVMWDDPGVAARRCAPGATVTDGWGLPVGMAASVEWRRNGYLIGSKPVDLTGDRGVFLDGLTVGIRYQVVLRVGTSQVELPLGAGSWPARTLASVTAYGVPRIPSVLLVTAPKTVAAGTRVPFRIALRDARNKPIPSTPVTIQYQRSPRHASAWAAGKKKTVKRVVTNRRGVAKARVTVRHTGTFTAVMKNRGKYAATTKTRTIRVR